MAEFWKDWEYVPQSGTVQRSRYFSLNAPGYREFLVEWLSQFRSLPLRGLILRHEVPVGVYEGMNPVALQSFQQAFNVDFDPVRVFSEHRPVPATVSYAVLPDVFWKMGRGGRPGNGFVCSRTWLRPCAIVSLTSGLA